MASWTPDDIRSNATAWSLEGDAKLLEFMESLSRNLQDRCADAKTKLNGMNLNLDNASVSLSNATNKLQALQHSQFVENRVYDEDETVANNSEVCKPENNETVAELSPLEALKRAIDNGIHMINGLYEKVSLDLDDDSDNDDEESGDKNIVLRPKDPYQNRSLPFLIGSKEWKEKWHIGLVDSDSESEDEEPQYSDTTGSDDNSLTISLPSNAATISESDCSVWNLHGGKFSAPPLPQRSSQPDELFRQLSDEESVDSIRSTGANSSHTPMHASAGNNDVHVPSATRVQPLPNFISDAPPPDNLAYSVAKQSVPRNLFDETDSDEDDFATGERVPPVAPVSSFFRQTNVTVESPNLFDDEPPPLVTANSQPVAKPRSIAATNLFADDETDNKSGFLQNKQKVIDVLVNQVAVHKAGNKIVKKTGPKPQDDRDYQKFSNKLKDPSLSQSSFGDEATPKVKSTPKVMNLFQDSDDDDPLFRAVTAENPKKTITPNAVPIRVDVKKKIVNLFDDEDDMDFYSEMNKNVVHNTTSTTTMPDTLNSEPKEDTLPDNVPVTGLIRDGTPDEITQEDSGNWSKNTSSMETMTKEASKKVSQLFDDDDDSDDIDELFSSNSKIGSLLNETALQVSTTPALFDNAEDDAIPFVPEIEQNWPEKHQPSDDHTLDLEQNSSQPLEIDSIISSVELMPESEPSEEVVPQKLASYQTIGLFDDTPPDDDVPPTGSNIFYDDFNDVISRTAVSSAAVVAAPNVYLINEEPPLDDYDDLSFAASSVRPNFNLFSEPTNKAKMKSPQLSQNSSVGELANPVDEAKISPGKPTFKKITSNLNINVGALLPGAKPPPAQSKSPVPSVSRDASTVVATSYDVQTIKTSDEPDRLVGLNKHRPKIQIKRKPSTRRGRQESFEKFLDNSDETMPAKQNVHVERDTVDNVAPFENPLFAKVTQKYDTIEKAMKTVPEKPPQQKRFPVKSSTKFLSSDSSSSGDDLFGGNSSGSVVKTTVAENSKVVNVAKKPAPPIFDAFASNSDSDSVSNSNRSDGVPKQSLPTHKSTGKMFKKPVFSDSSEDDEIDDLFNSKPNKPKPVATAAVAVPLNGPKSERPSSSSTIVDNPLADLLN